MPRITKAQRVRNMIAGLEEMIEECREPQYVGLRADIIKAIEALRKVWKNLVG